MTKIVKSMLVVDERTPDRAVGWTPQLSGTIIKGRPHPGSVAIMPPHLPVQDEYIDQLNRLRVEIRKAEEELRNLNAQIKEAKDCQARQEASTAQLWNIEAEMAVMIERAKVEAEEILGDARATGIQMAEEARNNGYLDGFSRGYEEAGQDFHKEYDPKMVMIADILDRLSDYEAQVLRDQQEDLVELAITVARKVIGQTLKADPATVAELLREVVENASGEQYVKVTLSPDLLPIQAKAAEQVRKLLTDMGAEVTLITQQGLEPGSALVETPKGVVDVSIETQLNNLKDAALGR